MRYIKTYSPFVPVAIKIKSWSTIPWYLCNLYVLGYCCYPIFPPSSFKRMTSAPQHSFCSFPNLQLFLKVANVNFIWFQRHFLKLFYSFHLYVKLSWTLIMFQFSWCQSCSMTLTEIEVRLLITQHHTLSP